MTQQQRDEDKILEQRIKDWTDPEGRMARTVVSRHEIDAAHEAIMLDDVQQVLEAQRKIERDGDLTQNEIGLLKHKDKPGDEDVGDRKLHIGPEINVSHTPHGQPQPVQAIQQNGNGLKNTILGFALGAATVGPLGGLIGHVMTRVPQVVNNQPAPQVGQGVRIQGLPGE